jgi:hypothetical protein
MDETRAFLRRTRATVAVRAARALRGAPVRGESHARADIVTGRVGPEQSAPRHEFD